MVQKVKFLGRSKVITFWRLGDHFFGDLICLSDLPKLIFGLIYPLLTPKK